MTDAARSADTQGKSQGGGCLKYGCLSVSILGGVLCFIGVVFLWIAYQSLDSSVGDLVQYVAQSPEFVVEESGDQEELHQRGEVLAAQVQDFLEQSTTQTTLTLTEQECDTLFQSLRDQLLPVKGVVKLGLAAPNVLFKMSLPIDQWTDYDVFGLLDKHKLLDKYINAEVEARLRIRGGRVFLGLEDVRVSGNPLIPAEQLNELSKENLAGNVNLNKYRGGQLRKIARIEVTEDGLRITRVQPSSEEESGE